MRNNEQFQERHVDRLRRAPAGCDDGAVVGFDRGDSRSGQGGRLGGGGGAHRARDAIGAALGAGPCTQYVRHDANTEDIVQDAVLNALKRLKRVQYRTVGGLQAYLRTSVVNRIRDLIRASKRRGVPVECGEELKDQAASPLESAIMREGLASFLAALQRLRPADRQVIIWRIELGYSVDEIAVRLGKSKGAAGMSVSRAMARLAKELGIPQS